MGIWKPDPSFYPSPRLAAQAPPEKLAYVAAFDPDRTRPDAIAVVDVDPASPAAFALTRRTRILSGVTWSCRGCAPRASISSIRNPTR
jgi:hypothetical protein